MFKNTAGSLSESRYLKGIFNYLMGVKYTPGTLIESKILREPKWSQKYSRYLMGVNNTSVTSEKCHC